VEVTTAGDGVAEAVADAEAGVGCDKEVMRVERAGDGTVAALAAAVPA
jgi:hypothetical protein